MRWYLRYSLSFRDVEELLGERGLEADHTTIWRWSSATVLNYRSGCAVISSQRTGPGVSMRPTFVSRGVGATSTDAIDSTGAAIDFVLSGFRDAAAAKRLFRKALTDPSHPQPRVINTDPARLYGAAILAVQGQGTLRRRC